MQSPMWAVYVVGALACFIGTAMAQYPPPYPPAPPIYPPSAPPPPPRVVPITLRVTVATRAPDCTTKSVILVNGQFMPTITVTQHDILEVTLINAMPANYPTVTPGITIHWHGLYMWDEAAWADGVPYVSQCPVLPGASYTFRFQVTDAPGTYLWHDHNAALRVDGLAGALVVHPKDPESLPYQVDGEQVLFLSDWWHQQGDLMAMQLNRPQLASKVTADSGAFQMVGVPQAVLINGKGVAADCSAGSCAPKAIVGDRGTATSAGCRHEVVTVSSFGTYLLRIVNAAASSYFTVCVEGHSLHIVGADALPTTPVTTSCVDVNGGERLDVLLVGDQPPGNYWISVLTQYSSSSPNAYAVLRYSDASVPLALPTTKAPQTGDVAPWTPDQIMQLLTMHPDLAVPPSYQTLMTGVPVAQQSDYYMPPDGGAGHSAFPDPTIFYPPASVGYTSFQPPYGAADLTIVLNYSVVVMADSGMVRWSINKVAMPESPPCQPMMSELLADPLWLDRQVNATRAAASAATAAGAAKRAMSVSLHPRSMAAAAAAGMSTFDAGESAPFFPTVGVHVARAGFNQTVDLVISSHDGEPHPFHLHGHKFWVLGMGYGQYDATRDRPNFNMENPMYKDTVTLPAGGWMLVRFLANNPGVWPLHCHNLWHSFMGQKLFLVEAPDRIKPPSGLMPKCPTTCRSQFFPFPKSWVKKTYGKSGYQLPTRRRRHAL